MGKNLENIPFQWGLLQVHSDFDVASAMEIENQCVTPILPVPADLKFSSPISK